MYPPPRSFPLGKANISQPSEELHVGKSLPAPQTHPVTLA
jgi:hypothetical protein